MIQVNVDSVKLNDFSAGFGTKVSVLGYPPNVSPDCLNVCSRLLKSLNKRNGYTQRGLGAWDSYTKLMLHCNGTDGSTTFTDEIGKTVTANGTAQIDTAQKKFGTASGLLDGDSDYLSLVDSDDWNFGTGDFTIDCWVRFNSLNGAQVIVSQWDDANNRWALYKNTGNGFTFLVTDGGVAVFDVDSSGTTLATNTWYHIALRRSGATLEIYVDGVKQTTTGTTTTSSMPDLTSVLIIGNSGAVGYDWYFNGWIDELRISKGIARWTANFTPSTSAYIPEAVALPDCNFLMEWANVSGTTDRIIASTGTQLKYMDNFTSTWTTAYSSLTLGDLLDSTFTTVGANTYVLITTTSRQALLRLDNAGAVTTVSAAPLGQVITNWENYTFIGNLSDGSSDIKYSSLGDYTTWPAANREYLSTQYGDEVRGFGVLKRRLYIFKDYTIFRYSFLGGTPVFQSDPLYGIGTRSPKTIKEIDIPDIGKVLVFLDTEGRVRIFDGYNPPQDVSDIVSYDNLSRVNLGKIRLDYINKAWGVDYPSLKWYILFFPMSSTNNGCLVFDYSRKPLAIWPFDNHNCSAAATITNAQGIKKPYFVDYSGNLFEFDSGITDNGTAVNAWWRSPRYEIGSAQLLKQGYQMELINKALGNFDLTLKYRRNWELAWRTISNIHQYGEDNYFLGQSFILGQSTLGGSEAVSNIIDIPALCNLLQLEITDNSSNRPFEVYSLEPLTEKIGVGG